MTHAKKLNMLLGTVQGILLLSAAVIIGVLLANVIKGI
jgi:hypothetical protein